MSIGDIIGVPGAPSPVDAEDVQRLMDQRDQARSERDHYRAALQTIAVCNPARASVVVTIARKALEATT